LAAQFDDPAAGAVGGWGTVAAGFAGRGEQLQPAGAEVTHQRRHRRPGVAEPFTGGCKGQVFDVVGAQRLVAALVDFSRCGEELPAGYTWGRYS
jgi:hypothetical protein